MKQYQHGVPLRCNNNTVIDGDLTVIKPLTFSNVS